MTNEEVKNITLESLRDWFKKEKWVRISSSGQRAATAAKKKKAEAKGKTVVKNTKKATVKEIGDLSQTPYKFTTLPSSKSSPYSYYKFITDNGTTYEVVFEREETDVATTYSMAFTAKGKEGDSFSSSALTGGNEPLKIMSTVADITKKHIDKVDDADYLKFEPTKGKEGEGGNSNTRAKLYKLIVKKNFPNLEVIADDDTVLIDLDGYYDDEKLESMTRLTLAQLIGEIVNDVIECNNCDWSWNRVDGGEDLYICHKCGNDNTPPALENFNDTKVSQQLKNYIEDYTDINLKLLKDLIKLKPKYPQQLDPRVGGNKFGYRGTTFNKEFINKLKVKSNSNGITEYEVPSSLKITSKGKRGFLSFSTDEDVAKGFGHYSGYVDHKKSDDRVGGYVKVSLDNPNFILHPDYMGELSKDMEYSKESEKETLFVGNSYTPESIVVVDEKIYKENFKDGKKKGKSKPGRVKKSGASCNGSVTDLRRKAKNASGEKAKMYHWCANMKGGKK